MTLSWGKAIFYKAYVVYFDENLKEGPYLLQHLSQVVEYLVKRTIFIIVAGGISRTSRGGSRLLNFTTSVSKLIHMPFPHLSLTYMNLERYWSQFL